MLDDFNSTVAEDSVVVNRMNQEEAHEEAIQWRQ
jgi:hypothetical protein